MPDFAAWENADWAAFWTMVYALVATAAAGFVYQQVSELRRTREDQARPFIVVDIEPSTIWGNILNLVVSNIGTTLAQNVTMRFEPSLESSIDTKLEESALLRSGIPSMPPGRRVTAMFDTAHTRIAQGLPLTYDVVVHYEDSRGRAQLPLRYVIDIGHLVGLQSARELTIHHAAKALEEIQKILKASQRGGRWRVSVTDEDEEARDYDIAMAVTGRSPRLGEDPPNEILMVLGRNVVLRTILRRLRELRQR